MARQNYNSAAHNTNKRRAANYDLLRIVSSFMVVMIHVSNSFVEGASNLVSKGAAMETLNHPAVSAALNSVSRFPVPCFLMLSGAFIMGDDRNLSFKNFYSRSFRKIGVPTLLFSIYYILYRLVFCFVGDNFEILPLLKDIVCGAPFYHMWYMYFLIGVYALAPIAIRLHRELGDKVFFKVAWVFLVISNLSLWTTQNVRLNWSAGNAFCYMGYFMIGYVIKKSITYKNNLRGTLLIAAGLLIELSASPLVYRMIAAGLTVEQLPFRYVAPYCPVIVLASVLIFAGVSMIELKSDFSWLASKTLYIYLIHAGLWNFAQKCCNMIGKHGFLISLDARYAILMWTVVFFVLSIIAALIYEKLYGALDRRFAVTDCICRAFGIRAQRNKL